jgi:hypothetical protein
MLNSVTRLPATNSRADGSSINLSNHFQLGDLASMRLFYSQAFSDNYIGTLLQGSNDNMTAGFQYAFSSPRGYRLDATWTNVLMRRSPDGAKTNDQSILLTATWQPQQSWRYSLNINSKASDLTSDFDGSSPLYRSNDTITATVTYTF